MKNNIAKEYIEKNITFHDWIIKKIEFLNNNFTLDIKIIFKNTIDEDYIILLKRVVEMSFFYSEDYMFYIIDDVKFLVTDSKFYLSLDPDMTMDSKSNSDQDYFFCEELEFYKINDPSLI